MLITKFRWWVYRKLNDNLPSRNEVEYCLMYYNNTREIHKAMMLYRYFDIQQIANLTNLSRERIKQYLLKGTRHNRLHLV